MSSEDSDIRKTIWKAAVNADWETVKQLLERYPMLIDVTGSTTIDEREFKNLTLLHLAIMPVCNMEAMKFLVSHGADINGVQPVPHGGIYGFSTLHAAVEFNSPVEVLNYLISQGADVNAKRCCETPLFDAAQLNADVDVIKCLVSLGSNIHEPDCCSGTTPLHYIAEMYSDVELWEFLILHGADVNIKGLDGWTPFLIVAKKNSIEVLKYLISQNADLDTKNNKGKTAFDVADTDEKKIFLLECMQYRGESNKHGI